MAKKYKTYEKKGNYNNNSISLKITLVGNVLNLTKRAKRKYMYVFEYSYTLKHISFSLYRCSILLTFDPKLFIIIPFSLSLNVCYINMLEMSGALFVCSSLMIQ